MKIFWVPSQNFGKSRIKQIIHKMQTIFHSRISRITDTYILVQKSPSPVICGTPSQFTFTKTKYHENELLTSLCEKLREVTTEMKTIKSFVLEQILLVKNSVNKFGNNTQLQEKSNEKYLTEEILHLREKNKTKLYNSNTKVKSK